MHTSTSLIAPVSTLLVMLFRSAKGLPTNSTYNVQLQSSTIQFSNAFDATLSGHSNDGQFSVNVQGNVGTVKQGSQTTNIVVWGKSLMASQTLYSIMGEDSNNIILGWVYCEGGQLTALWLEDTSGTIKGFTPSPVTGACVVFNSEKNVSFSTTSEAIAIVIPPLCPSINGGSSLSLAPNSVGNVVLGGQPYDLAPFTVINCSSCASTSDGGWWEVHSVMSAKQSSNVCVGIFYLPITTTGTVSLFYLNCFEDNSHNAAFFEATYSLPNNTNADFPSA